MENVMGWYQAQNIKYSGAISGGMRLVYQLAMAITLCVAIETTQDNFWLGVQVWVGIIGLVLVFFLPLLYINWKGRKANYVGTYVTHFIPKFLLLTWVLWTIGHFFG